MTTLLMSPRLPGVNMLVSDATGPQYARWRRGVESAFTAKGTWGHCDGTCPMPMPDSGPTFFSPVTSAVNPQPELLEERRAWVKKDRDVKLDIFLSVADDIKLEVFEVGPPLPPSSLTSREMLEALDERFQLFKFEDYHHVFCHFLNLHIDQYPSLADFNTEFTATLDDLLDHGYPLDNLQACSAYFSKLRCTQNPWVAKKLKDWDTLATPPLLADLMKECPPWMIIRPLTMKQTPQTSAPESYSEDVMGPSSIKEEEESSSETERSEATTASTSHSRNPSIQSLKQAAMHSRKRSPSPRQQTSHWSKSTTQSFAQTASTASHSPRPSQSTETTTSHSSSPPAKAQENTTLHSRTFSNSSQEITIHASVEDLSLPSIPIPTPQPAKAPKNRHRRVSSRPEYSPMPFPPPINRPLPPLPTQASRTRSASPKPKTQAPETTSANHKLTKSEPLLTLTPPRPHTPPNSQPQSQNDKTTHPALRGMISAPTLQTPPTISTPRDFAPSAPTLQIPFTSSSPPTLERRPSSSHSQSTSSALAPPFSTPNTTARPNTSRGSSPKLNWGMLTRSSPHLRPDSNSSSIILPLQGTQPEYQDTVMGGVGSMSTTNVGLGLSISQEKEGGESVDGLTALPVVNVGNNVGNGSGSQFLSTSPPGRSLMSRLSAELNDDEKKHRKRSVSWSLKGRIPGRRIDVREMI